MRFQTISVHRRKSPLGGIPGTAAIDARGVPSSLNNLMVKWVKLDQLLFSLVVCNFSSRRTRAQETTAAQRPTDQTHSILHSRQQRCRLATLCSHHTCGPG